MDYFAALTMTEGGLFRGISLRVQGALIRIDEIFHRRGHRRLRLRDIGQVLFHRPTAAERPEEPDERFGLHLSRRYLALLEAVLLPLGVEHVQIVRQAAIVTLGGDPRRLACGGQGAVEIRQTLLLRVKGRAGVVDLLDSLYNRRAIADEEGLRPEIGYFDLCVQRAEVEERSIHRGADRPDRGEGEQGIRRSRTALEAGGAGQ